MRGIKEEVSRKHAKAKQLLKAKDVDCLYLTMASAVSWITGGANVRIAQDAEYGVVQALVFEDRIVLLTKNIELERQQREELADFPGEIKAFKWHEGSDALLKELTSGLTIGTDQPGLPGTVFMRTEIAALRYQLEPEEIEKYRNLSHLTAEALESVAFSIEPGQSERKIAGALDAALYERGLDATVTLIAADERIGAYRHPVPTLKDVSERCLLVICARQYGLIAAASRLVNFVPITEDLRHRHDACLEVDATLITNSRPGTTLGQMFQIAKDTYAKVGYPDDVELHHQGGTIGYMGRENIATPGLQTVINHNQPVAWNTSITGTKSEDTYLITEQGFECLTLGAGRWPMVEVESNGMILKRPDILVR